MGADRSREAESPTSAGRLVAAPTRSRYGAGEHAQFGSQDQKAIINVVPTRGDLIAMGDFVKTPEDLLDADPEMLRNLDAAITRDRQARTGGRGENGNPRGGPASRTIAAARGWSLGRSTATPTRRVRAGSCWRLRWAPERESSPT